MYNKYSIYFSLFRCIGKDFHSFTRSTGMQKVNDWGCAKRYLRDFFFLTSLNYILFYYGGFNASKWNPERKVPMYIENW